MSYSISYSKNEESLIPRESDSPLGGVVGIHSPMSLASNRNMECDGGWLVIDALIVRCSFLDQDCPYRVADNFSMRVGSMRG